MAIRLEIITAERQVFSDDVNAVVASINNHAQTRRSAHKEE
jgi:F0F1-type ATP synthase epsilon subunit